MSDIKVGTKVRVIGSVNHYLEDGSEGVVVEIGHSYGVTEYAIEGYNILAGRTGIQYLMREQFEVIE